MSCTKMSVWLSLNWLTRLLTTSPLTPPSACQKVSLIAFAFFAVFGVAVGGATVGAPAAGVAAPPAAVVAPVAAVAAVVAPPAAAVGAVVAAPAPVVGAVVAPAAFVAVA